MPERDEPPTVRQVRNIPNQEVLNPGMDGLAAVLGRRAVTAPQTELLDAGLAMIRAAMEHKNFADAPGAVGRIEAEVEMARKVMIAAYLERLCDVALEGTVWLAVRDPNNPCRKPGQIYRGPGFLPLYRVLALRGEPGAQRLVVGGQWGDSKLTVDPEALDSGIFLDVQTSNGDIYPAFKK